MSSFQIYLREVGQIPLLTAEKERALIEECCAGSLAAKQQLVRSNLRLVLSMARQYQGRGVDMEDLVSSGHEGLLEAVNRFKRTRSNRFSTYAVWWIRCYVLRRFTSTMVVRVPLTPLASMKRVQQAAERILQQGRQPTPRQLAKEAGLSVAQVADVLGCAASNCVSLDAVLPEGGLAAEAVPSPEPSFEDVLSKRMQGQQVSATLAMLPPREEAILRRYYGVGCAASESLQSIANHFKITPERVRQLRDRALAKMKRLMVP